MTDTLQAFLDKEAFFQGKISFGGGVRVDGHVRGEINGDGTLVVGETGVVEATLEVDSLIVQGTVIGEIKARTLVEIGPDGRVEGILETSRLRVAEGARIAAKVAMREPVAAAERLASEQHP
jgi:cytoskeletal protein CcmA (bactofilin family)